MDSRAQPSPISSEDHSLLGQENLRNPKIIQGIRQIPDADLLKLSYHDLTLFHYDKQRQLPDTHSFIASVEKTTSDTFRNDPLAIEEDLNWEDVQRFLIFRFWIASRRFPELKPTLMARWILLFKDLNLDFTLKRFGHFDEKKVRLRVCFVLNFSRGFLENETQIVERTIYELAFINLQETLDPRSLIIAESTETILKNLLHIPLFQEAIQRFGVILGKNLTADDIREIIQELHELKITPIESTPESLYGMVLPNGIALNVSNIKTLLRKEVPGKDRKDEVPKPQDLNPHEEQKENLQDITSFRDQMNKIVSISLWIAVHELGHLILRTKPINFPLSFGKTTPPVQIEEDGTPYENLEGGFLFSYLLLGSFAKKIWSKPELMDRLLNPIKIQSIPVFNAEELKDLEKVTVLNFRNSGAFLIELPESFPMIL